MLLSKIKIELWQRVLRECKAKITSLAKLKLHAIST